MRTNISITADPIERALLRRVEGLNSDGQYARQASAFAKGTEMPYDKLMQIRDHYQDMMSMVMRESTEEHWVSLFTGTPDGTLPENTAMVVNVPQFVQNMIDLRTQQIELVSDALIVIDKMRLALVDLKAASDAITARYGDTDEDFRS